MDNFCKKCHKMYYADSHGQYVFFKQQYKQLMPESPQSHPKLCGFYTTHEAFQLFKSPQGEVTGVHNVNVLSFTSNYI